MMEKNICPIIFANRKNCLNSIGGDTIQMLKTKEYMERSYGVKIDLCTSGKDIYKNEKNSGLLHIFNVQTIDETLNYIDIGKEMGLKIALSPIYWDLSHLRYIANLIYRLRMFKLNKYLIYTKDIGNHVFDLLSKFKGNSDYFNSVPYKNKVKEAIDKCDLLLPNSEEELEIIIDTFKLNKNIVKKAFVIPNAVDLDLNSIIYEKSNIQVRDYVLEVGRIEAGKNQLSIVYALMDYPDIPIVFIGRSSNDNYFKKLKKVSEKRGNVFIINEVSHDLIYSYYKNAKVHVMPSFRESPGLSSLEALLCGCEIVVSNEIFCPIHYYKFNEVAHICNPYSINSIKKAILNSFNSRKNNVDKIYANFFSYDNVAKMTYKAYESII